MGVHIRHGHAHCAAAREDAAKNADADAVITDPVKLGEATYAKTCAACHQPTCLGLPGAFPPLAGSEWVKESDPTRIIRIVLHGVGGPIRVNGTLFNGVMPPPTF